MLLKLTDADDAWPIYIESQNIIDQGEDAPRHRTSLVVSDEGAILTFTVRESPSEIDRLAREPNMHREALSLVRLRSQSASHPAAA